jgi:hypothetical protein
MFKKYRKNEEFDVILWDGKDNTYALIKEKIKELNISINAIGLAGYSLMMDIQSTDSIISCNIPFNSYVIFDISSVIPIRSLTKEQLNLYYVSIDDVVHFENDGLKYRGYGIIPYNIKPVQAGIQYAHSIVEYVLDNFKTKSFQLWGKISKTAVLLDGGTSNHTIDRYSDNECVGTMEQHLEMLKKNDITFSTFYETDLNDMLSCIFVIADERTFDFRKYPDPGYTFNKETKKMEKTKEWTPDIKPTKEWIENIGGEKNYFLRQYLRGMKLWA